MTDWFTALDKAVIHESNSYRRHASQISLVTELALAYKWNFLAHELKEFEDYLNDKADDTLLKLDSLEKPRWFHVMNSCHSDNDECELGPREGDFYLCDHGFGTYRV